MCCDTNEETRLTKIQSFKEEEIRKECLEIIQEKWLSYYRSIININQEVNQITVTNNNSFTKKITPDEARKEFLENT